MDGEKISHNGLLSEPEVQDLMQQVVQAAFHCCKCGVLHGDIKPKNLLINTDACGEFDQLCL